MDFEFSPEQQSFIAEVEAALSHWVAEDAPERLSDAMRYAVLDGGKRLRPLLVLAACEAVDGNAEAALRAAGRAVQRWLLPVTAGAGTPDLGELPSWADALFVGNPTNPTGWLHRREALLAAGQGRLLVVDEAFMDATDEAESLIEPHMAGRLVLPPRSMLRVRGFAPRCSPSGSVAR